MLGRRDNRDQQPQPTVAADGGQSPSLAQSALNMIASPYQMFKKATGGANQDIGAIGSANSNMEISRLSLHYSSANLSEEESNSLINILDRKKYHERLSATRSAEEQIQPR